MCPALILAGGASKRMGRDKATIIVDGVAMVVRVAHALKSAGYSRILVSVRDGFQRQELGGILSHLSGIEFILDQSVERGTLPALYSSMKYCEANGIAEIQLAPCDLPWISPDIFLRLKEKRVRRLAMPRSSRLEPMLALVEVSYLIDAFDSAPRNTALQSIMRRIPHQIVSMSDMDDNCFKNVNRHTDLMQI